MTIGKNPPEQPDQESFDSLLREALAHVDQAGSTPDPMREIYLNGAMSFWAGVRRLLDDGDLEAAQRCAFSAWSAVEIARAQDPLKRLHALGRLQGLPTPSSPRLHLVVDNDP